MCSSHPRLAAVFTCQRCHSHPLTRGHRWTLALVFVVMGFLHTRVMLAGQLYLTALPETGSSSWLPMGLFVLVHALVYGTIVLAWMRLTGRVPVSS